MLYPWKRSTCNPVIVNQCTCIIIYIYICYTAQGYVIPMEKEYMQSSNCKSMYVYNYIYIYIHICYTAKGYVIYKGYVIPMEKEYMQSSNCKSMYVYNYIYIYIYVIRLNE